MIAILPLVFGLRYPRLRINSFDVSILAHLLNNRKNEGYKITDLTTITMGIILKKTIPKFTHYPINKKPHKMWGCKPENKERNDE